jgi:aspartate racemase
MKKIGLIGGVGPESTIAYYRLINKRYQEKLNTKDFPNVLIHSINMTRMVSLLPVERHHELINFLLDEIHVLHDAGMDYAAITSNTPHIVFDAVQQKSKITLISIVQETCRFIKGSGITKVILLGTKSTMATGFYNAEARQYGIEIISPDIKQQDYIHEKYLNELVFNIIRPETKRELIDIVSKLAIDHHAKGLILGGTELPLILNQDDFADLIIFDSASIHVDSIIERMVSNE